MTKHGSHLVSDLETQLIEVARDSADEASPISKRHLVFVRVRTTDGISGTGFISTIGTGGRSVLELIRSDLAAYVVGGSASRIEAVWDNLFRQTYGTVRGVITGMALAAIDLALWDVRGKALGTPLWLLAGGYRDRVPVYSAESGWIDLTLEKLVAGAVACRDRGWTGMKIKVGKPDPGEDVERVAAVRETLGPRINLMIDANQAFSLAEAARLARLLEPHDVYWFEEPLPADDVDGHARLAQSTSIPIAFGESVYTLAAFREYLVAGVRGFVQPDATRVGGVTPWLKIAHLAEAFNVKVAPHVRTELSVSLAGAVANGCYVEPHSVLGALTRSSLEIADGMAIAPQAPGLGIEWDEDALDSMRVA